MRRITILALLAIPILVAADAGPVAPQFKISGANEALAERDAAIARAETTYRQAAIAANNAYAQKIGRLEMSPAAKADADELARLKASREDALSTVKLAQTKATQLRFVSAESAASASAGLHKGMTRADLMVAYPQKPESDTTNSDGDETIVWEKKVVQSGSGGGSGGMMSSDEYFNSANNWSTRVGGRTTVELKDGVVVNFSVEKM